MSAPWCQPVPGPAAPAHLLDDSPLESPEPASTPCFTPGDRSMPFQPNAGYPLHRPRRLRAHPRLRELTRESLLTVSNLIYPLFVYHGANLRREVPSMPGQYQLSLDRLGEAVSEVAELGIPGILLFGIPEHKDAFGSAGGRLDVDNDATLPLLAQQALSHARAGADMIAPSGMMDGMVQAIRHGLDGAGCTHIPIMSYAAKFASGYYGPFRDAAESAPSFGDRRGYQMDPANGDEAIREVALDLAEGADVVMVKPALAYLDIARRVKDAFGVPVAAYNVSGEYAMVKAAAIRGWIDERRIVLETLTGFKRAGIDMILTYHALDVAR